MSLTMALDTSLALSLVFTFTVAMAIAMFLKHCKSFKNKAKKKLPPGDTGLPWIGETIDFYKAQRNNKIYEEFVQPRIAKYGKVFKTSLMGSPTIVINGAQANKFLLSNEFKLVISSWPSSSVQLMGKNSIMEKQGETHRCLRGVIKTTLNSAGLEALVPKMCNTVELHFAKYWQGHDTISLYRLTKILTFNFVFECLLGIEIKSGLFNTFERVLEGVFAPPFSIPGSKFSRAKNARMEIHKMVVEVVRRKKTEMGDRLGEEEEEEATLLSRLVRAMIRGDLSEEEVVDNVIILVFGAHDTTSFAVAMTFRMLAHHPDCYSRVLQEHVDIRSKKMAGESLTIEDIKKMNYTWQVARESMRIFPPIFGSFRKAIVDFEYEGFIIPRGWKVLWTTYGTHYNTEYFEDPYKFNPSRFEEPIEPYAYMPFGGGPRLCAGYQLAKFNILILVHYVVTHYDWSMINPEEPITMDPLPFPSQGMPIRISPKIVKMPPNF